MGGLCASAFKRHLGFTNELIIIYQHYNSASQIPPTHHSWLSHIRKEFPTEDTVMQNLTPSWQAVSQTFLSLIDVS